MTAGGSEQNRQVLEEVETAYSEWGGSLLRFSTRLCGNRDDAEEVVVDTFTEAFRTWDSFRGTGSRRGWLYGIAANRCRMTLRRRRPTPEPLHDEVPAQATDILDRIALEQAIGLLPLSQREAFLLVKSEGLTSREAADLLGRPIGTILYEVFTAVRSLRSALTVKEVDFNPQPRLCEAEP